MIALLAALGWMTPAERLARLRSRWPDSNYDVNT